MTYCLITDNIIRSEGGLPQSARRTDTDEWVLGLPDATIELQQATGWFQVADTVRPDDTATETHDRSLVRVGDVVTETWTARPWTVDELAGRTASDNATTLRTKAAQALDANATFMARTSPTNAQVVAHVRLLTREMNALIRLTIGHLGDITDS